MCKHILNAQVSIRAPCCQRWFDCSECHEEKEDHELKRTIEMVFACKKCKKVFRKNLKEFDESDEYCPNCDNHYYVEAQEKEKEMSVMTQAYDPREKQKVLDEDEEYKQEQAAAKAFQDMTSKKQ